jgi:hypothetical protein
MRPLLVMIISYLIKLVQIPFQIKLKNRSTVTNLLDEELLKDVIKRVRREEKKGKALFFWKFQE